MVVRHKVCKGKRKERAAENSSSDIKPLDKELKSPRRTTAVLNITTEAVRSEADVERTVAKKSSLKQSVLEKLRPWVNSLLEAEGDEFLGRGRHQPLDEEHANYRNRYPVSRLTPYSRHNPLIDPPPCTAWITNSIRCSISSFTLHGISLPPPRESYSIPTCKGCPDTTCKGCHDTEHREPPLLSI
jgi:hypothetical protein